MAQEVVLKFSRQWFRELEVKRSLVTKQDASESDDALILSHVHAKVGDYQRCEQISKTLASVADIDGDGRLAESELISLLALIEQQEPAMLMALNGSEHTPMVYGYCGGLYVVEVLPFVAGDYFGLSWAMEDFTLLPFLCEPLDDLVRESVAFAVDHIFFLPCMVDIFNSVLLSLKQVIYENLFQIRKPTVQETFAFLLQLMDLLQESSGRLGVLQSCDAHISNFGITKNLTVKAIDFDLTFSKPVLSDIMAQKSCLSHEDCRVGSYDECRTSCNFDTGFCPPKLESQDLQYICGTIFQLSYNVSDLRSIPSLISDCLRQGISKVEAFCTKLPHANTTDELHVNVKKVSSALKGVKKNCLGDEIND